MRRRSPGAGNARELKVMAVLASEGWLCASRRHIGGAGDILAICTERWEATPYADAGEQMQAMLIEVKSTTRNPWNDFGPADRQALVETAEKYGAVPWLYWWPPRGKLLRIPAEDFPPNRKAEVETFPSQEEARAMHARAIIERSDTTDPS